jgi:cell division protein FtsB
VLVVVVILLALSYVSSLRILVAQQHDLAVADHQIAERSAEIDRLEAELARWDDPAYVKAQARDRFGWVMPGETGYRVIGEDGQPLGGGVTITAEQELPAGEHQPVWWDRLWGSVQAADAPKRKVGTP